MGRTLASALLVIGALRSSATAEPAPDTRHPEGAVARLPFESSRLFAMPIADVVGAFEISLSGDGSLLKQPGVLSSAGVIALGFGDVAQLEYRHSSAVGITGVEAPIPAVGVQLKIPYAERRYLPATAIAFRLGVPRRESVGDASIEEAVTDVYLVAREHLWGRLSDVTVHLGTRISSATVEVVGEGAAGRQRRTLLLPTGGWEWRNASHARVVGELSLAPQFRWDGEPGTAPTVDVGVLGRLGMRWQVARWLTLDSSLGYQVDVARAGQESVSSLVSWDIRLGAEVFVSWRGVACSAIGALCHPGRKL